ncbi:oxidoreductase-like domain-containing protein 1 [Ctenocephalides felis]|uniref:oxidoreductase-like domain-containing protein 1 n=1 Tax=Ctenocephalides felis TaxID=7515 RepID=UPI000E6E124D|nr:oxidoreductase-like domain-containing protein 1 [Ctenocephalides felis]
MPEEPTTCCMSGCANCVWIEYAEKLTKYYLAKSKDLNNSNDFAKVKSHILNKVSDSNMQAYLMMELRILEKKIQDKT